MTIPAFPDFVPLGLEHKPEIDAALARVEPVVSELTFTNLFIWRHYYHPRLSLLDGQLLILSQRDGKPPFFFPPWGAGDIGSAVGKCLDYLKEREGCVERASQEYINKLEGPGLFETIPDPDNDDYVYNSEDLIRLEGRKYDGKRNAIKKFQKAGRSEYRPITPELIPLCLELRDYWCAERQCELYPGLTEEKRAITEAFSNYAGLGLKGGAIMVDGKVEAFALGEKLNKETFVVHIEKANPGIPGLYAVINQQFAENEASSFKFINREQDLGDEGLRRAKESYHPAFMVRKFRVCRGK